MDNQDKPLWSSRDIAEATGLTQRRVAQLLQEGAIVGYKVGHDWIVQREEALHFIDTHVKYQRKNEAKEENEDSNAV